MTFSHITMEQFDIEHLQETFDLIGPFEFASEMRETRERLKLSTAHYAEILGTLQALIENDISEGDLIGGYGTVTCYRPNDRKYWIDTATNDAVDTIRDICRLSTTRINQSLIWENNRERTLQMLQSQ